jgi:methyl-accepting chemotaxis protein
LTKAVDRAEEYQKSSQMLGERTRSYMIFACIGAVILSLVIGVVLARSIGRPLTALSGLAQEISEGDLRVNIPVARRKDEIGMLGAAFAHMLSSLKDQTSKVIEAVSALSAVAGELSTTTSQLSQSASRTSAAVTEVSTTMEEVRQAAKLASTKAEIVVDTSQQALKISGSGKDATEKTIDRITVIRDQMKLIGETVVRLSERSRAIEDIVVSVQDLADQSNLLAVNASIEAARAGDRGKGFTVVADEIRSLADQSREATEEIRAILSDTQKWVSAVVMATEQGTKAVESGVEQSLIAGEAIKSLVDSVANSAQAASVIGASTTEQLAGTEQASTAMISIEQTMRENLAGSSQVEASAKKLQDLGGSLGELVQYYKI